MTINQFTYMATSVRGRGVGGWGWLIKVYSPTHQWSLYQIKLQNTCTYVDLFHISYLYIVP